MKKPFLIICILALFMPGLCLASGTVIEIPTEQGLSFITSQNIPVLTTGVTGFAGLTARQASIFREAYIQNTKGDTVRYRIDGTNPTTTVGFSLTGGTGIVIKDYYSFSKFLAIADSTGSGASLFVIIYGR